LQLREFFKGGEVSENQLLFSSFLGKTSSTDELAVTLLDGTFLDPLSPK